MDTILSDPSIKNLFPLFILSIDKSSYTFIRISWILSYCAIIIVPPWSCVVVLYITNIVTLIHNMTNMKLNINKNIKYFSVFTWKRHGILGYKGNFCLIFAAFIFQNCNLIFEEIFLVALLVLVLIFLSKLASLVLPLDLEHSSHIISLNSIFHKI